MAQRQQHDAVVWVAKLEAAGKFLNSLVRVGRNLTMTLFNRGSDNLGSLALSPE